MDRKKELKMQYKQMKPQMGIFIIRSRVNNKCFLKATQDLRGVINGAKVRLEGGFHPNRELQQEWSEYGAGSFTVEILEHLEYGKDESKTDYSDELAILQMIWEEKLTGENMEFYKKRI
jgi:hypothetical protein